MLKAECSSLGDGGLPNSAMRSQGRGSAWVMVASHVAKGPRLTGVTSGPVCSPVGLGKDEDEARGPGVPGQCLVGRHDWGCAFSVFWSQLLRIDSSYYFIYPPFNLPY